MKSSMVDVPGGSIGFMMLPEDRNLPEQVRSYGSGHVIPGNRRWTVSGFRMSAHPVTRRHWTEVMGTSPWPTFQDDPINREVDLAHHPATCISYDEATAFCSAISSKTRRYRLPTELEWEYACRCGSDEYLYSWNSSDPQDEALASGYAVFSPRGMKRRDARLTRVGSRSPNAFGLYDLVGLVSELVLDRYHVHPQSMKVLHGELPAEVKDALFAQGRLVVHKGGGFDESLLRGSYPHRVFHTVSDAAANCGFRVVEETPGWAPTILGPDHQPPPRRSIPQPASPSPKKRPAASRAPRSRKERDLETQVLKITVRIEPLTDDFPYDRFSHWIDEQINAGDKRYCRDPEISPRTYSFYGTSIAGVEERFRSMQGDVFPYRFTISAKPVSKKTWDRLKQEEEWDLEEDP